MTATTGTSHAGLADALTRHTGRDAGPGSAAAADAADAVAVGVGVADDVAGPAADGAARDAGQVDVAEGRRVQARGWLAELEARAGALVSCLSGRGDLVGSLTGGELERVLCLGDDAARRFAVLTAEALVAAKEKGEWDKHGYASLAEWRAAETGQGRAASIREARVAETLELIPEAKHALEVGEITRNHAEVLTRFATRGDHDARVAAIGQGEGARLVGTARRVDAGRFAREAERAATRVDRDHLERNLTTARAKRSLTYRRWPGGGIRGEFTLDNDAGQYLIAAIEARLDWVKDPDLTIEQRRADALSQMAKDLLDSGTAKPASRIRPHLSVHLTGETLLGVIAEQAGINQTATQAAQAAAEAVERETGPRDETGSDADDAGQARIAPDLNTTAEGKAPEPEDLLAFLTPEPGPTPQPGPAPGRDGAPGTGHEAPAPPEVSAGRGAGDPADGTDPAAVFAALRALPAGAIPERDRAVLKDLARAHAAGLLSPAQYDDGSLIPSSQLAKLLCDCRITPLTFTTDGRALHVGRTSRTMTPAIALALYGERPECWFPGCDRPPGWGEGHHIISWADGGQTEIRNTILLCRADHDRIHRDHIGIHPITGGHEFRHRDGRLIGRTYRQPLTGNIHHPEATNGSVTPPSLRSSRQVGPGPENHALP